jgi:hypothetical protein
MKIFLWAFASFLLIGMVSLNSMEKKPLIVKGDIILLPEHLTELSQEEQEIFGLTEDDEYANKLGVAVQITSAEREVKKGKEYLLKTYATAILGNSKNKLSEEAQCNRILNVLGNWHNSIHPIIKDRFSYRVPFNFITKRKLKTLVKGKFPQHLEICSSDKCVLLKLFFARDRYAYAGETSCSQIAEQLMKEYKKKLHQAEAQEVKIHDKQIEQDEQLAIALEQKLNKAIFDGQDDYEEIENEFPVI